MRSILLLAITWGMQAQTCSHQVTRSPVGPVLVFQNTWILTQGEHYIYTAVAGKMPNIDPLRFRLGDVFKVVYSRQVPLSIMVNGAPVTYATFQNWEETWTCTEGNALKLPKLLSVRACSGAGTVKDGNGAVISSWDCAGLYSVIIELSDGSFLSLIGAPADLGPGNTWTPK